MTNLTYSALLDLDGRIRNDAVRASDGNVVLTGFADLGGETVDVLDGMTGDKGPTEAYRAWLAAGGKLGDSTPDLVAYAAAARYAKETAGITVGTAPIATDRASQALITGMWAAAQITPSISVAFKASTGFVTINAQQVEKIATAVAAHVQACFTAEAQVDAAITAGTITTTKQIDDTFSTVTA